MLLGGGGIPLWIPDAGSDVFDITPDNIPDVNASDFAGGIDSFGVEWVPLENGLPSMVRPGSPVLKDVADWEKLPWPDVSAWAWKDYGDRYKAVCDPDRINKGIILSGYFERLISLMDFEWAATALIEDPDSVYALFDRLTDFNIAVVDNYIKYFNVDAIMIHDDWGAQFAPFFSMNVVQKLFIPHMKRLVDHSHRKGLIFTHHCCGNVIDLIPAMIEIGADICQLQETAIDLPKALELYADKIAIESYWELGAGWSDEQTKAFIDKILGWSLKNRLLAILINTNPDIGFDPREYWYTQGRKMVAAMRKGGKE